MKWTCEGSVRGGCGVIHGSYEAAERHCAQDTRGIRERYPSTYPTCSYSDRVPMPLDREARQHDAEEYLREIARSARRLAAASGGRTTMTIMIMLREHPRGWLAYLGLGSHMTQVYPDGVLCGPAVFPSMWEAEARALEVWRATLDAATEAIRAARGGTLDWGIPAEPLEQPRVVIGRSYWCTACDRPATRLVYYGAPTNAGDPYCDGCIPPCNHPGDPYMAYRSEEAITGWECDRHPIRDPWSV